MDYKIYSLDNQFLREVGSIPVDFTGIVEWTDGQKEWFVDGKWHRTDGPAIEQADGTKHWFLNGKPHRIDGPALECANGKKSWYINGDSITEKEQELLYKTMKLKGLI